VSLRIAVIGLVFVVLMAACPARAEDRRASTAPVVVSAEPLIDLAKSTQALSARNFELSADLAGLLPGRKGPITASVTVSRIDGQWKPGTIKAPGFSATAQGVSAGGLVVEDQRISGMLRLALKADREGAAPEEHTIACTIDAQIGPLRQITADNRGPDPEERFWVVQPQSQGMLRTVEGTWQAEIAGRAVSGDVTGRLTLPVRPGRWNMGAFDNGLSLVFDMGTVRQNWNHVRLAICELDKVRDLSAFSGLRLTVTTDQPRSDVSLSVWLREEDGSWYYLKSAVPLADRENHATVLFEDFAEAEWVSPGSHMDEDYVLDLTRISHIAVGVVNSLGVGSVHAVVKEIDLVKCQAPPLAPAQVRVTGRTLSINGHDLVPAGLFGGYAGDLPQEFRPGCQRVLGGPVMMRRPAPGDTEAFLIDCWFDRYSPAVLLGSHDWEQKLQQWGREYGEKTRAAGYEAHLEFWNEPYLNWATRPGKNYDVKYFNVAKAVEGGPVQVLYRVPEIGNDGKPLRDRFRHIDGPVIPHFAWKRSGEGWRVVDRTQFTYWSGLGNGWIYDRMCAALGQAVKQANPSVQFVAGWGFRWNEDHWAGWDMLYKPTIDRNIAWIDGLHEHHYQGDTTAMNGSYEVLVAYGKTAHDKWLYCYNTETNDLVDAPARGVVDTPEKAKAASQYRKMVYNLRDIAYCILQSPDKVRSRTVIHNNGKDKNGWTAVAYGLMKNLRGRLVETVSDDRRVWCVASIDGTDPRAMPKDGGKALVVLVFNDHRKPREIELAVALPAGTTAKTAIVEEATVDRRTFALGLRQAESALPEGGRFTLKLPDRGAWKVTIPLAGEVPSQPQVQRRQFFSPTILQRVERGKPVVLDVALDEEQLKSARRAWLRLVVEDIAPGEAAVILGSGNSIDLPKAYTADNVNAIVETPVAMDKLSPRTRMEFRVHEGNFDGWRLNMASIVLESSPGEAR